MCLQAAFILTAARNDYIHAFVVWWVAVGTLKCVDQRQHCTETLTKLSRWPDFGSVSQKLICGLYLTVTHTFNVC